MTKHQHKEVSNDAMTPKILCIPHADYTTCADQVKTIFETVIGNGSVLDVKESSLHDFRKGVTFKRYFVYIKFWSESAEAARQRLIRGESINIMYCEPWFWKCSVARTSV